MFLLSVCICLSLFSCANTFEFGDLEKYGPMRAALKHLITCDRNKTLNLNVSLILVYYHDFSKNITESYPIQDAAKGILAIKDLNKNGKFIIWVGGFKSHITKKNTERIKQTFREHPNSYLIVFDHSPYTHAEDGYKASYERSVKYVYYIGKAIGKTLADLSKGGINPKQIHCIGHSLGAQILATAGETFINETGTKIWKITGLDPAGPCFTRGPVNEQIRAGVAEYVEVYHCNAGGFGTSSVLADVNFFINRKGEHQPNCKTPPIPTIYLSTKAATCSHRTCIQIYTNTVSRQDWFPAWRCDSYKKFKKGHCRNEHRTVAGFWNPGEAKGVYYFTTKDYELE